jgi:hypothetical protein
MIRVGIQPHTNFQETTGMPAIILHIVTLVLFAAQAQLPSQLTMLGHRAFT